MNSSQQKKSRRSLLMVLAAFALPVILAKLALELNWLDYGVTNQGTLVENELTLTQLGLGEANFEKHWLILYILPKSCTLECEKTLETVHNTYTALGREVPRVIPVALYQSEFSPKQQERISDSKWRTEVMPSLTKNMMTEPQILIVDPLGNVVLKHLIPKDSNELPSFGKMIVADMKKLLKYSRIG